MARRRRCKGTTKAGKRCKASPLRGKSYCSAHDPDSPAFTRFGSPEQAAAAGALGGRPRMPRAVDLMREWAEEHRDELLEPYVLGLRATVTLMARADGAEEAIPTEFPDIELRQKSAERFLDRVYGKPRQTIEHAGPESGAPIAVEFSLDKKARKVIGDALRGRPATG